VVVNEILNEIGAATIVKQRISAPEVLNEAYHYERPSSFSRALRVELGNLVVLFISGTASVDEHGQSVHIGDFRAQTRRMFENVTALLHHGGATWADVVRTWYYLRDIDRDYAEFNEERTAFYREVELDPLPASTGIEAKLCRPELLVEMEAVAIFPKRPDTEPRP
jgi:enamine deaminase RidA (YjgF/YER057c/UK114 family)